MTVEYTPPTAMIMYPGATVVRYLTASSKLSPGSRKQLMIWRGKIIAAAMNRNDMMTAIASVMPMD